MARRPTIGDLAEAAGVSVATVDRVLNGRHPVREETARRVFEAATELGYHADRADPRSGWRRSCRRCGSASCCRSRGRPSTRRSSGEIRGGGGGAGGASARRRWSSPRRRRRSDVLAALAALARRVQAVAMVAPDHPSVTAAVEALRDRGVPVFALLSDFARRGARGLCRHRQPQGRAAPPAWMVARAAPAAGQGRGLRRQPPLPRPRAARDRLPLLLPRACAGSSTVLETLVNLETRQITHEATLSLLARHPDLVGLYVAGGGMEGAITALREQGMTGRVALVVPELTAESRAALAEGLVTMAIVDAARRALPRAGGADDAPARHGAAGGAGPDLPAIRHLPAREHLNRGRGNAAGWRSVRAHAVILVTVRTVRSARAEEGPDASDRAAFRAQPHDRAAAGPGGVLRARAASSGSRRSRSATTSPAMPSSTARRPGEIAGAGRGCRRRGSSRSTRCSGSTTGTPSGRPRRWSWPTMPQACGAEALVLVPSNDGSGRADGERRPMRPRSRGCGRSWRRGVTRRAGRAARL